MSGDEGRPMIRNGGAMDDAEDDSEEQQGGGARCWCWARPSKKRTNSKKKKKKKSLVSRSIGGWTMGSDDGEPGVGERVGHGDLEGIMNGDVQPPPEHLVILVNGIIGSADDWRFAAERLRSRLGRQVAIHCSGSNASLQTFDGVDVMGKRLANEVRLVIDKTPGVTRISFLAHSLGGLVSRYAIAELYCPPTHNVDFGDGVMDPNVNSKISTGAAQTEFTIGGLQPENFITLATPHLGCRGTDQLPFLFGIQALEKTASSLAHWFVGRTGRHLFLTDGGGSENPLLRKMVTDCKDGQFYSSLAAFKRRTTYANVVNDHMVGWRTASIRRKSEMPELSDKPVDSKYPHIVREEDPAPPLPEDFNVINFGLPLDGVGKPPDDALEEEMVGRLTQMAWHRVDVSFRGAKGSSQAHNLIQVKSPKVHYAGEDVIEHVIDKQFVNGQQDIYEVKQEGP